MKRGCVIRKINVCKLEKKSEILVHKHFQLYSNSNYLLPMKIFNSFYYYLDIFLSFVSFLYLCILPLFSFVLFPCTHFLGQMVQE